MPKLVQRRKLVPGATEDWPSDQHGEVLTQGPTSKISVMAPPGTVMLLNNKTIVVGASGIYDFDVSGIDINSLSFPEQENTSNEKTEIKSQLNELYNALIDVLQNLKNTISKIDIDNPEEISDQRYFDFCDSLRSLLSQGFFSNEKMLLIGNVISRYITLYNNFLNGNASLENIIVNYITKT